MVDRFERFSFAMFEITRAWHRLVGEEMERLGLKGPQGVYLLTLHQHPEGLTASELRETCGRDKGDVSRVMAQLEEKQIIRRDGSAYRAKIYLTERGEEVSAYISRRAAVAVEMVGNSYSEEYREIFYQVLETISQKLQLLCESGLPMA